ncbi:uncharacterized protein LOC129718788 isoform X2 [Wyeomyia smithii]|uniref:uncharacterized protein LOC129718788 isoform X2 n=1 Tax=Wyeomyia smithii TaxID=174621 RepID=UPI002467DD90|nr:uncharacterized protein LOC129718788 isoform X2 [Wyeomyia smithii]XP_055525845.1 uncharacterized protein LOC129718788 isoform X2 [Wyeomyia smithii]
MAPRSNIWMYFDKGHFTGACKHCGKIVKTAGNTMNMWNHLQRRHPKEYAHARGMPKTAEIDGSDPLSVVEEVVTTENILTQEQFEIELGNGGQRAIVRVADCDLNTTDHPKKPAVRSKPAVKRHHQIQRTQNTTLHSSADDIIHITKTLASVQQSLQSMQKVDSFQVFGNFVAEEIRKIPEPVVANQVQRKLTRFLMDCMDEVDTAYCSQSMNKNDF